MNRLVQVTDPAGGVTRLTYDASGARISLRFANGITGTYGYDGAGRLTSIVYANATGEIVEAFVYQLDAVGNRLSKTFADGTRETYLYDDADRLTKVVYGDGRDQTYTLDRAGNRLGLSRNVPTFGTTSYTYNAFNQLLTQRKATQITTFGYDLIGALTSKVDPVLGTTTYHYNSNQRLERITFPATSGTPDNVFAYDVDGLRVFKEDSAGVTQYLLDGPEIVTEYDGALARTAVHVHNPQRIDELFVSFVDDGTGTLRARYPLTDALGSIYALTGPGGLIETRHLYDVFGERSTMLGTEQIGFGFTGREHEAESSVVYSRMRYLLPEVGGWSRSDPAGFMDGPNVYIYVVANPVQYRDPNGLALQMSPFNYLYSERTVKKLKRAFELLEHPGCACAIRKFDGAAAWDDTPIFVVLDPSVRLWGAAAIANPVTYWIVGYIYLDPAQDAEKMAQALSHESGHFKPPFLGHEINPLRFEGENLCGNYSRALDKQYFDENCACP